MPQADQRALISEAFKEIDAASHRLRLAVALRDFAQGGQIDLARETHAELCSHCAPASAKIVDLAELFPQFRQYAELLTIAKEAEAA